MNIRSPRKFRSKSNKNRRRQLLAEPLEDRRVLATVTLNTDMGAAGELRTEIANASPGDTIDFQLAVGDETILLSGTFGELVVDKPLTINGDNAAGSGVPVTVSGDDFSRVFNVDDGIAGAVTVLISDLTITGGNAPTGGGILNAEGLHLVRTTVSGNTATAGPGGGISSVGYSSSLSITDDSLIDNNYAYSGGGYHAGGGIFSSLGTLMIADSTISNNRGTGTPGTFFGGGGIAVTSFGPDYQYAPLDATISGSVISGNTVFGDQDPNAPYNGVDPYGGGMYASGYGTLIISDSRFTENSATGTGANAATGGAIALFSSGTDPLQVEVMDTLVSGNSATNRGGGIGANTDYSYPAPLELTITNTTISDNSSDIYGGGFWDYGNTAAPGDFVTTITNSTISGNSSGAGGGITHWRNGYLYLESSTVSGNRSVNEGVMDFRYGGGIANYGYVVSTYANRFEPKLVISNSTVSGNSTYGWGGGIYNRDGQLEIHNSTISGNSAGESGGGLYVNNTLEVDTPANSSVLIQNSTFTENSASGFGGGMYINFYLENWSMSDTIVSGNTSPNSPDIEDYSSAMVVANNTKYSLIGDNTGSGLAQANPDANGNIVGGAGVNAIDALLGTLDNNGGLTQTHELLSGSPAIDKGDISAMAGVGNTPLFDQRGNPFGRVEDGDGDSRARLDMGAFEVQSTEPLSCDFNGDSLCDIDDLDLLYNELGSTNPIFNLDGVGVVDNDDVTEWLAQASAVDAQGRTFVRGDADLDGNVGGPDFTTLALNFGSPGLWGDGNFVVIPIPGGGNVDGPDFTALALNFGFTSAAAVSGSPNDGTASHRSERPLEFEPSAAETIAPPLSESVPLRAKWRPLDLTSLSHARNTPQEGEQADGLDRPLKSIRMRGKTFQK